MARKKSHTRKSPSASKSSKANNGTEKIGVVGLGLMGTSIVTCLLGSGHPVTAVSINATERRTLRRRLRAHLKELKREGMLKGAPETVLKRLTVSGDFKKLAGCEVVIEAVVEDLDIKRTVIERIEEAVGPQTVIGSNTSAIPITLFQTGKADKERVSKLQNKAGRPDRIIGIHWAEPAHVSPFLEVICGDKTSPRCARCVINLARRWGKDPSMLQKDVRGFITNRCFYALLREAFHLVESGIATMEDVDRSLQNDLGYFMALAGPFRWMDLTGIPAYATVMEYLWPDLSSQTKVPKLMKKMIKSGGRGIANQKGFYKYTAEAAKEWEKKFVDFSYDIHKLASKYRDDA